MKTVKPESRKEKNQGMNWISQHKRLSIYLRDGLACCYCGSSVTEDTKLTLDHLNPYSNGGTNHESNLITCCHKCNSSRGNRSYEEFANATASYLNHGIIGEQIISHIQDCISRALDVKYAKELIERQGSCFQVLKNNQF